MYKKQHVPKHDDYTSVMVMTVPGRSYSIAELLQRVYRGQPLPMLRQYDDSGEENPDPTNEADPARIKKIEDQMDSYMNNPANDPDLEISDVKQFLDER